MPVRFSSAKRYPPKGISNFHRISCTGVPHDKLAAKLKIGKAAADERFDAAKSCVEGINVVYPLCKQGY
jgi:hypothetical protein